MVWPLRMGTAVSRPQGGVKAGQWVLLPPEATRTPGLLEVRNMRKDTIRVKTNSNDFGREGEERKGLELFSRFEFDFRRRGNYIF